MITLRKKPILITLLLILCSFTYSVKAKPINYHLVWSDEFNYRGFPDTTKWSFATVGNFLHWGNNELQYYTREEKKNAYVSKGNLRIQAIKNGDKITSARLESAGKGNWKHARVEVRAKLASGRGVWSAIWLLPSNWNFSKGYVDGEIDVAEYLGFNQDSVFHAVHTYTHNFDRKETNTDATLVFDSVEAYHVYAVEWNSDTISFFIDDKLVHSYIRTENLHLRWSFNQPYSLILNVAVGGEWAATKGIDYDCFPVQMYVDYVRVYEADL